MVAFRFLACFVLRGFCSVAPYSAVKKEKEVPSAMQRPAGMSWLMVGSTLAAATGGYIYLQTQLHRAREQQVQAQEQSVGQALVGGPFTLSDCNGKAFASSKLHGEFSILYFGFTHCPDICPDELEKMAEALNLIGTVSRPLGDCSLGGLPLFLPFRT